MTDETNERNMERLLEEKEQEIEADLERTLIAIVVRLKLCDLKKKGLLINKINQVLREMKI